MIHNYITTSHSHDEWVGGGVMIWFTTLSHTFTAIHTEQYENVSANLRFKITSVNKRQYVMALLTIHDTARMRNNLLIVILPNLANLCDVTLVVEYALLTLLEYRFHRKTKTG